MNRTAEVVNAESTYFAAKAALARTNPQCGTVGGYHAWASEFRAKRAERAAAYAALQDAENALATARRNAW